MKTMKTILEKTTSTGVHLRFRLEELTVTVTRADGTIVTRGTRVYRIKPQRGFRHAIGADPGVGLTDDEAVIVTAAIDAAIDAAIAARRATPAGQREQLASAVRVALDEWEAGRAAGFREDIGRLPSFAAVEQAQAALAAFDAAHPELAATIAAEREATRQQAIAAAEWN